ncbi:MAG: hypothetical protein H6713_34750 [Myxococcales bacterium]|nr:hypothetical protein [Myxococcales bacterium]
MDARLGSRITLLGLTALLGCGDASPDAPHARAREDDCGPMQRRCSGDLGRLCPYGTLSVGVETPAPLVFLEPDARGVRWISERDSPPLVVTLLRFADGDWRELPAAIEPDGRARWIRPAVGWEPGASYRVGVSFDLRAWPSVCRDFVSEPFWSELGVRPAGASRS